MSNSKLTQAVNIEQKLALFNDYWNPKLVGEINEQEVKVVKLKGEFVWHDHPDADELFLVIKGHLIIHFRDKDVQAEEGEFIIVPRGVEHKPEAQQETHIVLIDQKGTVNTGNTKSAYTVKNPKKI
ncbi:MAG TPA: cupin domain-containing protein [Methylomirabilota bacterium]|nr:cupin domain-containing protein [Methylomirabilota bacterium]